MKAKTKVGTKLVRSTSLALAIILTTGIIWNIYSQTRQARLELLDQSRVLAAQILAIRKVVAENQNRINFDKQGRFEFKHLNPAAMVKYISAEFNIATNYQIRQVSLNPRVADHVPDRFEREQLLLFEKNPGDVEAWGEDLIKGKRYFRYMIPLYIETSCLPCHGNPKGEQDISGHSKEGYEPGHLAGALAISIPMEKKEQNLRKSIFAGIGLTVAAILFSAVVIIFHTNLFVTKPIELLNNFTRKLGEGKFDSPPVGSLAYGEIRDLMERFSDMAGQLQELYSHLEFKVEDRTRELAEANKQLARISQYKSEFLATMSHELRTPLAAILAFTEELLKKEFGHLSPEQEDYLNDIQESGHQLLGLINELLDLSKIESGQMNLNLIEVNPGEIVWQIEKLLQPLADKKNLEITLEMENTPQIIADEDKVRQVIQNLLSNAIKFSPPDGKIEIRVASAQSPVEEILISVKDHGPGIPEGERQRIFDPFYQVEQGLNRQYYGTGLGLALVKKIVDVHLGRIKLVSEVGQGSEFIVFLPVFPLFDEELE